MGFWVFKLIPPSPPSGHPGLKSVRVNACHGALGGPFFDHFFDSILDSILDSSWVRFGLVLGASWDPFGSPNRVKLGQKSILKRSSFKKVDVHETLENVRREPLFGPQDGPKMASRPVQDGSKSDQKVMQFSS